MSNNMRYNLAMCFDDDEEEIEEIEELYTIIPVIDSGVAKVNHYDQRTFTSALVAQPISKASAEQRKGRAGRTAPGICYRLYTKESFKSREDFSREEITRSDLAEVALRMSDLAIYDYDNFPFITPPKKSALASAKYTLSLIGAIDDDNHLTSTGEMMVRFPLIPRLSRAIVEAVMRHPAVLEEVLIAVSFLSTKGPFLFPQDKAMLARTRQERFQDSTYGDFAGYLKLYREYTRIGEKAQTLKAAEKAREKFCRYYFLDIQTMDEIVHIKGQLELIVSSLGVPITSGGDMSEYLICLGCGLLQFVCILDDSSSYRSLTTDAIYIHPSCSWFRNKPGYILAGEVVQTSRMFARSVSPLKAEWLDEIYPDLKNLLRYTRASGYENIRKSYDSAIEADARRKSKKSEKDGVKDGGSRVVFGYTLRQDVRKRKGGKGDVVYLVKLKDLKDMAAMAFQAGSVPKIKVRLSSCAGVTTQALPLKTYIQEADLIADRRVLDGFKDEYFTLDDDHAALSDRLDMLFTPCGIGGGKLGFLTIVRTKDRKKTYKIHASGSLPSAVDTAFSALNDILDETHSNRKRYSKLQKACQKILDQLSKLEGLE